MIFFEKKLKLNIQGAFSGKSSYVYAIIFFAIFLITISLFSVNSYIKERNERINFFEFLYSEKVRLVEQIIIANAGKENELIKQEVINYWHTLPKNFPDEYFFILDDNDSLVINPSLRYNTSEENKFQELVNPQKVYSSLVDLIIKEGKYVGEYFLPVINQQLIVLVPIDELGWTVGIFSPLKSLTSKVNRSLRYYIVLLIVALGLLFPLSFITITFILRRHTQIQKIIKNRENQFREVFNSARDCMIITNSEGIIISANIAVCKTYKYENEKLIGKHINILSFPNKDNTYQNVFEKLKQDKHFEGETTDQDSQKQLIISESKWMEITIDDNPYFMGIIRDITEKKKAREALLQSEEKFRTLADLAPFSIAIYDLDKYYYMNMHYGEITGYSKKELEAKSPIDLIHPKWQKIAIARLKDRLAGKEMPSAIELLVVSKSGTNIWIELYNAVIKFEGKNVVLSTAIDISERKRKEKDVKAEQQKLKEIFNEVDFGIVLVSMDKKIQFTNKYALKTLGYKGIEEVYNYPCCDIFCPSPNDECPIVDKKEILFSAERHIKFKKSNKKVPILKNVRVIELNNEKIILESFIDISKQKEAEENVTENYKKVEDKVAERTRELEEQSLKLINSQQALTFLLEDVNESRNDLEAAYKELDSLNKELEAFSYSVSHDLRAPLTRLDGFSKILLQNYSDKLDDKGKHYLNRIRVSSQHMAQLINDILTLSKLSRKEVKRQEINISLIAKDVLDELNDASNNRKVKYTVEDNLNLLCDRALIEIVLRNLIENAWKFSCNINDAHITIGGKEIKNRKTIFVKDNGVGFNMNYYSHLFKPFGRLHPETEFEGTGIGLATVQRIINRHQGEIWAESVPGEGATFYFTV